ncbi:WD40 repeat domain-containing protein [Symmachiella dynata]|uniref:WD40 repeat domain-containing protein n=1 Tax=Symmachiella dynata TaxID=2527995 RepID=UPI00119E1401|nr:WD40 repeat domain-containing protein [Symmachiella dynata]
MRQFRLTIVIGMTSCVGLSGCSEEAPTPAQSPAFEINFGKLATELDERGYPAVIDEARVDQDRFSGVRFSSLLDLVRPVVENDPGQLWYQLHSHAQQEGWADFAAQLERQRPPDMLASVPRSPLPPMSSVLAVWKVSDFTVTHIGYSSDRSKIYIGALDGKCITIDAQTLEVIQRMEGLGALLATVKGPHGDLLIVYDIRKQVLRACRADTGEEFADLGRNSRLYSDTIYFSDGPFRFSAISTSGGRELLFETETAEIAKKSLTNLEQAEELFPLPKQTFPPRALLMSLSPNPKELLLANVRGMLWRFSYPEIVPNNDPVSTIKGIVTGFAMNPDSTRLATVAVDRLGLIEGRKGIVTCFDLQTNQPVFERRVDEPLLSTAFVGDGNAIVAGGVYGTLYYFSPSQKKSPEGQLEVSVKKIPTQVSAITKLMTSSDGNRVFAGNRAGYVRLIDTEVVATSSKPRPVKAAVIRRALSPDEQWEADFSPSKVNIRETESGELTHVVQIDEELSQLLGHIKSVALLPDIPAAILGGTEGIVHWNLATQESHFVSLDLTELIQDSSRRRQPAKPSIYLSPNGKRAVAFWQKSVAVFDAETGRQISLVTLDVRYFREPIAFLAGNRFAVSYQSFQDAVRVDGVRLFDLESGEEVADLLHGASICGIGFARKTGVIVTLGKLNHADRELKFATWRPGSELPELTDAPDGAHWLLGMTDDGQRLFVTRFTRSPLRSHLTLIDWSNRNTIRNFDLDVALVKQSFDGRTIAGFTRGAEVPVMFQYHRDGD